MWRTRYKSHHSYLGSGRRQLLKARSRWSVCQGDQQRYARLAGWALLIHGLDLKAWAERLCVFDDANALERRLKLAEVLEVESDSNGTILRKSKTPQMAVILRADRFAASWGSSEVSDWTGGCFAGKSHLRFSNCPFVVRPCPSTVSY